MAVKRKSRNSRKSRRRFGNAALPATRVTRSFDGDGWVVRWANGVSPRSFFADRGGVWWLRGDGTLGRQTRGTGDVRIPRTGAGIKAFLRKLSAYEGEDIVVER